MKITGKLTLILITILSQISCNDWLELEPPEGLIRQEFWQTKEDVESVVIGAYSSFAALDNRLFIYGEMRGDLVKPDINLGSGERLMQQGSIYDDNWLCNWADFYKVINYCNEVIYFAPGVQSKDKTFTDYMLAGYISEAIYLRSLTYFYLVRVFKDVPYVTEPSLTDADDFYYPKTDGNEILDLLKEDLNRVRNGATVDGYLSPAENKGRATKASIDALLADIALWQFNYEECITYINRIEALGKYELVPMADWFTIYYPGNSLESIYEIQYEESLQQFNQLYGMTNYNSRSFDPSDFAVELFDNEDPDKVEPYRGLGLSIMKEGENDYIIWKYVGLIGDNQTARPGIVQRSANYIIYRLSDIYLMKAEALSQLNRYDEALDYITYVREARGFDRPSLVNTPSKFEDFILEERARELAFEGKRWFDLLRMGRRNNYARKTELINTMVKNAPSTQKRILMTKLTNPLSWYMPIYKWELERNKNLVQNPYYNF